MANSFIQVPTDGAGKQVDTRTTDGDGDHRQVIVIGDQATDAALTEVLNTSPIAADYGMVVRNIPRREGQVLSTATLGIAGVFTQAWQDANEDGTTSVEAAARADQAAASDGFVIQQTDDDTDGNFTETVASKDVSANTTTFLHATITARKWRIQYTNGGTGQGSFKITSSAATVPTFPIDPDGKGLGISAQFDDTATELPDENELAALRITAQRGLHVNLRNVAGTEVGTTAAPVGVQLGDGTDTALVTAAGELNVISSAQAGVDIGDVTVNNGAGGAAVNIQDGGNSITVDNAALSVVGGGTEATALRVTMASDSSGLLSIDDNAGSLTVDAPTGTPVNVQIGDGTDQALVTAAGELNVMTPASSTRNEAFAESFAVGGELDDTATVAATEGNVSPVRITPQRAFHTNLRNDAGTEIGTTAVPVGVQIGDGTDTASVTAGGELNVIATAQAGVDIGDVTINNASGGAAVNIQDGGNSITVDAPVATPAHVRLSDGTDVTNVTPAGELNVIASAQPGVDIGDVTINNGGAGAAVNIQDGGNSLTVDAPVATPVNVQLSDGTDTALVTTAGELNTQITSVLPVTATGTMTGGSESVTIDVGGYGSVAIQISGTWSATVGFDATVDGTIFQDLQVVPSSTTTAVLTTTVNGIWYVDVGGLNQIRVFTDAFSSGTVQVDMQANVASGKGVVAAGASGGTSETDDSVFTGASTSVTPMGALFDATPPSITDGRIGAPRMNTNRVMLHDLFQIAGTATSANAGNVDAGTQRVVLATDQAVVSIDDNAGSITVDAPTGTPVNVQIGDGTDQAAVTASNELSVLATAQPGVDIGDVTINNAGAGSAVNIQDGGNTITVDAPTGTPVNVQIGDGTDQALVTGSGELNVLATAQAGVDIGDVTVNNTAGASAVFVQGQAAHDAAVAGNPVTIAGRSNANEPTAVSGDGEAVFAWMDRFGRQITVAGHPSPEAPNSTNVTASGNTELIATPGGGLSLYIKKGSIHNSDPTSVVVQLKDGAGGTVRWQAELAATGGGSLFDFGDVGWKLTANTELSGNLDGSGDVNFNITEYYISA